MLNKFQKHLENHFPYLQGKKLLIAASGGVDSMVLTHLFQQLNYEIYLAHCNFNLRGKESDEEQNFVENYAKENNLNLNLNSFDTKLYAKEHKLSIQVAARQLRYIWFYQILEENKLDFILTAHHLNDSLETFFINLSRGTGLNGLVGIPSQNDKIVRPLLNFSREEILEYAEKNSISWREDSSNASTKYVRNHFRHEVLPEITKVYPQFLEQFKDTLHHLQQAQSLVSDAAAMIYQQVVTEKNNQKFIRLFDLKRLPNYEAYLYQWLQPLGFTAWNDIYDLIDAETGKYVVSEKYRISKDRDFLIVEPIAESDTQEYYLPEDTNLQNPISLNLQLTHTWEISDNRNKIFVDKEKLKFPLIIRKWRKGDYFCPFGIHGSKKVSKFFRDEKFTLSEKENSWLLLSENQVVWIIGKAQDQRFKVNDSTKQIIQIEFK
ncbi:tRNA lysidine(34) synthetase TilS [Flavobacterium sp. NST-5]|uniref:tRNA(Ile)-lysidine synthase n=1 Tax=Flavobacterium ichthyis TaxID=2698827 RepID=A0ABW9Z996_9FLAO|nr:tRNA lysidine(34) synthetase TilS [Flavobacterium ichthyis]NBL63927.1 tRNA lysidine(34) synthetase TilS [Flavobacterium ichthyis]